MTHQGEEAMQHDISKLRDQVQQISLSQKVKKKYMEAKMDGFKKGMEAKMDGLKNFIEEKLKGNMEDMKIFLRVDMKCLKEGLKKLLE